MKPSASLNQSSKNGKRRTLAPELPRSVRALSLRHGGVSRATIGSWVTAMRKVSGGKVLSALKAAMVVCMDLGAVEPQCLLPQQPLQNSKEVFVEQGGQMVSTTVTVFDLHAFLTSPSIFGPAGAVAVPAPAGP